MVCAGSLHEAVAGESLSDGFWFIPLVQRVGLLLERLSVQTEYAFCSGVLIFN